MYTLILFILAVHGTQTPVSPQAIDGYASEQACLGDARALRARLTQNDPRFDMIFYCTKKGN